MKSDEVIARHIIHNHNLNESNAFNNTLPIITMDHIYTSSTAQGGGGSFKKRKTIGEIGCCESRMSKQKH